MSKGNVSAFPSIDYINLFETSPAFGNVSYSGGLTKREEFAKAAMQALISKLPLMDLEGELGKRMSLEEMRAFKHEVGISAVDYADALLAGLEKESAE